MLWWEGSRSFLKKSGKDQGLEGWTLQFFFWARFFRLVQNDDFWGVGPPTLIEMGCWTHFCWSFKLVCSGLMAPLYHLYIFVAYCDHIITRTCETGLRSVYIRSCKRRRVKASTHMLWSWATWTSCLLLMHRRMAAFLSLCRCPMPTNPGFESADPQFFGPGSSFKTDFVWADQQRVWLATWCSIEDECCAGKVVASNLQSELSYIRYRCVTNAVCPLLLSKAHTEVPAACGCLTAPALCRIQGPKWVYRQRKKSCLAFRSCSSLSFSTYIASWSPYESMKSSQSFKG